MQRSGIQRTAQTDGFKSLRACDLARHQCMQPEPRVWTWRSRLTSKARSCNQYQRTRRSRLCTTLVPVMSVSFIEVAPECDFPIQNLPYGVFSRRGSSSKHIGVAIGDQVLDLSLAAAKGLFTGPLLCTSDCFLQDSLNGFMALGKDAWREARSTLTRLLSASEGLLRDDAALRQQLLVPQADVVMHLPAAVGDYTDFYASRQHATNVGEMYRGRDNALQPNWLHLPVGYHGRASSIVPSGTAVRRPRGQVMPAGSSSPQFGPSAAVDFELEVACLVGPGNALGKPIPVEQAAEHMFGLVLMNDWSARDIQKWEYVPLGPFNGKNWATQISPWVVTMYALAPFALELPGQEPQVLPYLQEARHCSYDVQLQVDIEPAGCTKGGAVTTSNLKHVYWTFPQMIAHHSAGGCPLRPGDLLGSGTISGPGGHEMGSLLELSWGASRDVQVCEDPATGSSVVRRYLADHDTVALRGHCQGQGFRVGFGECRGQLLPS